MQSELFENLYAVKDKKPRSSTHTAAYLTDLIKFNIPIETFDNVKKSRLLSKNDGEILDIIISCLKENKKLPYKWTPHEVHYCNKTKDNLTKIKYLIYRYKFKHYPDNKILTDFPLHVMVEPTSVCNFRCVMCYQIDKSFTGDNVRRNSNKEMMGRMDMNLFKKVIDECEDEGANAISLGSRGEPMLHRQFSEMLNYISTKKNFFDVKINTNGSALTEKLCHSILKNSVNILVISCEAETAELYEKIRVGGKFNKLLKNIKMLSDIREKYYKDSRLEIRISGVLLYPEQNQINFLNFWKKKVDVVVYVKPQQRWDTYNNEKKSSNHSCDFLWEKIYVWWNGVTNPCDEDYKSLLSPGNIKNTTIKNLWKSDKLQKLRKLHLEGKRLTATPCDRCTV